LSIFQISSVNIFNIPPARARIGVMCYGELHQNMPHLSPRSRARTEFHKIPGKHTNSTETDKFRGSPQNSTFRGKLWTLSMKQRINYIQCHSWSLRQHSTK